MSDLIKRSDAIDVINEAFDIGDCCCDRYGIIGAIQSISSADRPQGDWIRTENHTIKCCECGAEFTDDIMDACLTSRVPFPKACPICMARMKGEYDE